jgi:hypothetical protein
MGIAHRNLCSKIKGPKCFNTPAQEHLSFGGTRMPTGQYPRKNNIGKLLKFLKDALKVETDECQVWPFCKIWNGYGVMRFDGRLQKVHRVVLKLTDPSFVESDRSLHRCDNRPCFNPRHLFKGTQSDNVNDCVLKGRANRAKGERQHLAKLSMKDVLLIRSSVFSAKDLALTFGVSKSNIFAIRKRKIWKHVP